MYVDGVTGGMRTRAHCPPSPLLILHGLGHFSINISFLDIFSFLPFFLPLPNPYLTLHPPPLEKQAEWNQGQWFAFNLLLNFQNLFSFH